MRYSGRLQKSGENYEVTRLTVNQLGEILTLQHTVFQQLENKETLEKLTEEEYQYILEGNGLLLGAFVANQLIAVRALLIPRVDDKHLGLVAGLERDELEKVIYQEITFVHPTWRGNGLQRKLGALLMQELDTRTHDFQYVCSTVAPFNIPSMKDKFHQGMRVVALEEIYGEKLRYVFIKDVSKTDKPRWDDIEKVPLDQIEFQQELLRFGWAGYEFIQEDEQAYIAFGKSDGTSSELE